MVDGAWLLMRDREGRRFLYRMAKAARKRSAGLCVVTQDAADLGLAVVATANRVLMGRSAQSIDAVTDGFRLTNGDARLLLAASRGEGLLVAGRTRVSFRSVGSAAEHELAVTGLEVTEMLAGYGRTRAPVRVPVLSSTRVALTARGDNR